MSEKSAEQVQAEKEQAKAAAKAAREAKAAEDKAAKEAANAEKDKAAAEAKAAKEAEKAKQKAEADAAKAAKAAEKAAKAEQKAKSAEVKVKVVQPSQYGITRPKDDTKTGRVWAIADAMSAKKQAPVAIAELMPKASAEGLNDATIRTQYARWKQFNGVFGPVAKAAPVVQEQQAA